MKWNIDTGVIDPNTTPLYSSKKNNFQPRVSLAYAPGKTVFKTGFGIFVGPGQTEDQIQPVESDRVSSTISNSAYPIDPAVLNAAFINSPNTRSYQPRAYANDYTIPERVYQYTASVQQELPGRMSATRRLRRQPGSQPVPAQRREPDHRRLHEPEPGERGHRRP